MTLPYDTHYDCAGCSSGWSSHVNAGLAAWNNSSTTIYYSNAGSHNSANDVHVYILSSSSLPWGGFDEVYDESYTNCGGAHNCTASQSRPNTWWYEYAYGNDYYVPLDPFLPYERTALIAHELGHGLSFDHPGGVGSDGSCGAAHIMDYDCIWGGQYQLGAASDVCGVNHKFYDPNWGYSGCQ